jgi:hypothetical protein
MFREAVTFAEPVAEQIRLMRQTIVEIEEELAQSAMLKIAANDAVDQGFSTNAPEASAGGSDGDGSN